MREVPPKSAAPTGLEIKERNFMLFILASVFLGLGACVAAANYVVASGIRDPSSPKIDYSAGGGLPSTAG